MFKPEIGQAFWAYDRSNKMLHRHHFLDAIREQASPFIVVEHHSDNDISAIAEDGARFIFTNVDWGFLSAKKSKIIMK